MLESCHNNKKKGNTKLHAHLKLTTDPVFTAAEKSIYCCEYNQKWHAISERVVRYIANASQPPIGFGFCFIRGPISGVCITSCIQVP